MEVTLIDSMGDDLRVVNAARVSFAKESDWDYIDQGGQLYPEGIYEKKLDIADQKLIKYLAKHNHWTPFSHVQITMQEKVPIFVARQRFKHMVGFTYNEVSRRYVDDTPDFYMPDVWRSRPDGSVKQGSGDGIVEKFELLNCNGEVYDVKEYYDVVVRELGNLYESLLNAGVAPEQARMVLPQSAYTEYYVTGSLAAWARAYKLRIDPHAQKEIQVLAGEWNRVISGITELQHSWKALTE